MCFFPQISLFFPAKAACCCQLGSGCSLGQARSLVLVNRSVLLGEKGARAMLGAR